jgi:hypothetical protein
MGASNYSVSQMAPQSDKLIDNSKALIARRSRCRLAHRMEQWAATADDNGQRGMGTNITPTPEKSILDSNRLRDPLLDGVQGRTDPIPQPCGGCPALGLGSNRDEGDEMSRVDGDTD